MSIETWLYYTLAILILTASPGPSVLLCLTKAISKGFRASIYTALGSLFAIVIIMTLSFVGLGAIITSSTIAFNIAKWLGAGYLIYLGYRTFTSEQKTYHLLTQEQELSAKSLFVSGFMVGASNPKAIVFFTALFPQFIDISKPLLAQYLIFVSTFSILELSWLLIYLTFAPKFYPINTKTPLNY